MRIHILGGQVNEEREGKIEDALKRVAVTGLEEGSGNFFNLYGSVIVFVNRQSAIQPVWKISDSFSKQN